jgi:bifunctional non-homologous end joining protein LigD
MAAKRQTRPPKLVITHPEKVLYPAGRFTKAQVVEFYLAISKWLLPHLKQRPVTLKRYPDGVHGDFFYEKDAPAFTPQWVQTTPVPRRDGGPDIRYITINDAATLAWVANIASLELHPFLHRAPPIDTPTAVVFDLDPGEGADIRHCAEAAFLLKDLLDQLQLAACTKVSGSKGLQVYVPLNTPVTYEATQPFARAVAQMLEQQHPKLIVSEMAKNLRQKRVFIDWSQNADHKTTVSVYSLRAKQARPFVSMPVTWEELHQPEALRFSPNEALERLARVGDLFAPVLKLKQKLPEQFQQRSRPARALAEYERKRNFTRTSEPAATAPRRSRQGSRRRFVVQKHAASHLHYDFRLEMHDVLKSWAVPRGVPLKKGETRSAFPTEDHPVDYLDFEGIIPPGEYGGGTVMVWDIGTYEVLNGSYWKGELTVFLSGSKLRGEWTLQRAEDKWLLSKTAKAHKRLTSKQETTSALSSRTMEQIAGEKTRTWRSNRAPEAPAPEFVAPMKATAVERLPEGEEWLYEIKWDGYRTLALKHGDSVRLLSLKNKSFNADFPAVVRAVEQLPVHTAIIDGEVVAVNSSGVPSFQKLQNRSSLGREWQIVLYAFDLLGINGEDLKSLPLCDRKTKLRELVQGSAVRYSAELEGTAEAVISSVRAAGLEGVVAKRRGSRYQPRTRSHDWLKLKLGHTQEFVIGGYNPGGDTFQSLLVGYYDDEQQLSFSGKVRQGFNPASRRKLMTQLKKLQTTRCPFANLPSSRKSHFGEGVTAEDMKKLKWVKPTLVAQVQFTEWTTYGLLRHATFLGLRDDKAAADVRQV